MHDTPMTPHCMSYCMHKLRYHGKMQHWEFVIYMCINNAHGSQYSIVYIRTPHVTPITPHTVVTQSAPTLDMHTFIHSPPSQPHSHP